MLDLHYHFFIIIHLVTQNKETRVISRTIKMKLKLNF